MLGKRYENDGMPLLKLNELQVRMKHAVEEKIAQGIYRFEQIPCCVCAGTDFEPLATKDRYGLYAPAVICKQCGLIQTNPRMTQESYDGFYNSEYRLLYLGEKAPSDEFFQFQHRVGRNMFNFIAHKNILAKPTSKLLVVEVGCGAGGILHAFREKGCRVKGVDLGEEYLAYGKEKYGLDLSAGTLKDLPSDGEKPDLIIYHHVLETCVGARHGDLSRAQETGPRRAPLHRASRREIPQT